MLFSIPPLPIMTTGQVEATPRASMLACPNTGEDRVTAPPHDSMICLGGVSGGVGWGGEGEGHDEWRWCDILICW